MNDQNETPEQPHEPPTSTSTSFTPIYKPVGGWLMFFCIGLTVLNPIYALGSLANSFKGSSEYFNEFPGLLVIFVIEVILRVSLMTFSIYAGVGLLRIRPGAVEMATRFLLCLLGYTAVSAILPFMAGLPSEANDAMIGPVAIDSVKGVMYVAVWYLYLNTAQRVKDTYHL
jgi:hypothetical protein